VLLNEFYFYKDHPHHRISGVACVRAAPLCYNAVVTPNAGVGPDDVNIIGTRPRPDYL
jgi:hypothetical protein